VSGFAGIIRLDPTLETVEADRAAIARMAEAIAFRGPDARQQWQRDGASFAFSLLTTGPAPQSASQPVTLDGETWLLGDVRVDGREELIRKLEQHGTRISGQATSEELVLHACAQFGADSLPELHGDFSFILWKPRERRLIAFRDLSGCRPFFYTCSNGMLAFSNAMQALLGEREAGRREYDPQFICNYLLGSAFFDPDRTVYSDVRRLPLGSLLEFSAQNLSVSRVARLPIEESLNLDDEEVIGEFRRLFRDAVRDRLPAADTTIFLSGGLDSTTIAASAAELRKNGVAEAPVKLRTLTVDLKALIHDEEGFYAERCAKALGIPFELLEISNILPFDGLTESCTFLPEPARGLYWMRPPVYFSHAAKTSRVALAGDGGDEILRVHAAAYLRYLSSHFGAVKPISVVLSYMLASGKLPELGMGIRSGILRLLRRPSAKPPEFPEWFTAEVERQFDLRDRFKRATVWPTSRHPFNPGYAWFDDATRMAVWEEFDSTWTGSLLECRFPFMDRRLLGFLLRLPPVPWFMEKEIVRRAQKGILPEEIRRRRKAAVLQDPMLVQRAAGKWSFTPPAICPAPLDALIRWPKVLDCLHYSPDASLRVHLGPVVVATWLKAVENGGLIQYSRFQGK
jgi:asparagine synthase (glutamine-hydrolysing)